MIEMKLDHATINSVFHGTVTQMNLKMIPPAQITEYSLIPQMAETLQAKPSSWSFFQNAVNSGIFLQPSVYFLKDDVFCFGISMTVTAVELDEGEICRTRRNEA